MKKVTKWHMLAIGVLILSLGILSFWLALCFMSAIIDKILFMIAAGMLVLVSSIFFVLFTFSFGKTYNVFLYDRKLKREINVDDLTFERICEFLDLYMGAAFNNRKQISFSDFNNNSFLAPVPEKYHSLFLMRLLLIWMEYGDDEKWKQFAETDKINIDAIVNILSNSGEFLISSRLQYLRASYDGDDKNIKDFFNNNVEYLKIFILNYVKDNIHKFD